MTARFDGGRITSDGGALLLRELEEQTGLWRSFAECFVDHREPSRVRHGLYELVAQRLYGLALGYMKISWTTTSCGTIRCSGY
jgi:hypothetical protein